MKLTSFFEENLSSSVLLDLFPSHHKKLLQENTSGVYGFHGYLRLYGIGNEINVVDWNKSSSWRFAWEKFDLARYVFFGGDVFGEQFAYKLTDDCLIDGKVYLLTKLDLKCVFEYKDFSEFYENYFLKYSETTTDFQWLEARKLCGDVFPAFNLVQIPSELITGSFDPSLLTLMDAKDAMVVNGDIASQILFLDNESYVNGMETYKDANGRNRLRVVIGK